MECREFQITLVSAQNLENVRQFFKNRVRVYAKVSLGGNPRTEKTTPVDKEGQTNPVWNFSASYIIGKNAVKCQDVKLLIQFFCSRTSRDTNIGEVSVSLKELFDRFSTLPQGEGTARVSYPVKKGAADSQGEVGFSFKFGDIFAFVPGHISCIEPDATFSGETNVPGHTSCIEPDATFSGERDVSYDISYA